MDAQALLGRQLGCFCIRFRPRGQKTTDSTERLDGACQRTARFSSHVAARQTGELYNVTLAAYSRGVQSKEFIAMMHPVNRCSLPTRNGIWTHRQLEIFPRTRSSSFRNIA